MAQHDYDIANQSGANFRADLNNALDAIVSNNSGSSEPSTTFAYEWWIDTSANVLKLRNSANNAWITLPLSITADNSTSGALTVNGTLTTSGSVDINGQELILDADQDTSITADTDDQIDFRVGAVDVMTLTNSHLVLKGTTPKITIGDGGEEDTALIFDGNAQDFYIGLDDSADDLLIGTGSTVGSNAKVVIENGGNVGIGTQVPESILDVTSSSAEVVYLRSTNATTTNVFITNTNATTGNTANLVFAPANNVTGATIKCEAIEDFSTSGNRTADLLFLTRKDGTLAEKMRIDSSGNVGIGTSSPQRAFHVNGGASDTAIRLSNSASGSGTSDGFDITIENPNPEVTIRNRETHPIKFVVSSTEVMRITNTGNLGVGDTAPAYRLELPNTGTTTGQVRASGFIQYSDGRLKTNRSELDYGLNVVKQLEPLKYFHKSSTKDEDGAFVPLEEGNQDIGFIAQDVLSLIPEIVGVPENDETDLYSLNYAKFTAVLVKALQELEERVTTLEG